MDYDARSNWDLNDLKQLKGSKLQVVPFEHAMKGAKNFILRHWTSKTYYLKGGGRATGTLLQDLPEVVKASQTSALSPLECLLVRREVGAIYLESGELDQAKNHLEFVADHFSDECEFTPSNAAIPLARLADQYKEKGSIETARKLYDRAEQLINDFSCRSDEDLYTLGRILLERAEFDLEYGADHCDIVSRLKRCLVIFGGDSEELAILRHRAYLFRGTAQTGEGHFSEAFEDFITATEIARRMNLKDRGTVALRALFNMEAYSGNSANIASALDTATRWFCDSESENVCGVRMRSGKEVVVPIECSFWVAICLAQIDETKAGLDMAKWVNKIRPHPAYAKTLQNLKLYLRGHDSNRIEKIEQLLNFF